MPDYEKLLQASMPEALDSPIDTVNFVYQNADQLLQANVSALDDLNYCVFAYFNRDEIFYLNQSGRRIISPLPISNRTPNRDNQIWPRNRRPSIKRRPGRNRKLPPQASRT
ncbi:MAG: hypothetical protein ACJ07L_17680 [Opitutales bacterium]